MILLALFIGLAVERLLTRLFHLMEFRWLDPVFNAVFRRLSGVSPVTAGILLGLMALALLAPVVYLQVQRRPARGKLTRALVLSLCGLAAACSPSAPPVSTPDSTPARRIITLAPHLAELVYTAGAGDRLVGVVEYTDYPPAARRLPRVGDAFRVDYESIAGLHPDVLLAWRSGNPGPALERLGALGYRVVALEPVRLDDIAAHLIRIGELAGTRTEANRAASAFRGRLAALQRRNSGAAPIRVFVQLSDRPYFTVTGRHFLGQGIAVCGGTNVFAELPGLTPAVALEAVLDAAPEVIVASDMGGGTLSSAPLRGWAQWSRLPAVRAGNLFLLNEDLLSRPSVRILDGIERLCALLDSARAKRIAERSHGSGA